ncbi:MAG: rubrerythrin family protein [Deltaproteobacteria bacterium]|nr:rubrerythrin family protein [Deltaproteobacteria bacterium]
MTSVTTHTVRTEEDLLKAYECESQAKWTYNAFAEVAEKEGKEVVARLFRAASAAEEIHAGCLLRSFKETSRGTNELWKAGMFDPKIVHQSTAENLREAICESRGLSNQYEEMVMDAERDGWDLAGTCFRYSGAVDRVHEGLFTKALDNLDKSGSVDYYICEACGNTLDHKPSGSCDVCGSSDTAFRTIH